MGRPVHSPMTIEALQLLAASIKVHRLRRKWTISGLAQRIGVSHPTVIKIERGDPTVAIGTFLEAAVLVGVPLFDVDPDVRVRRRDQLSTELSLLPRAARSVSVEIDDDF